MRVHLVSLVAVLGLLPAAPAVADTIELNGGTQLDGVLLTEPAEGKPIRLLLPRGDEIVVAAADVRKVAHDKTAPKPEQYLRYEEPGAAGGGLDVAVASFVPPDGGPRVDLVGAVHLADGAYFREIQRILEGADIVLYEGVKPKDATAADFQAPAAEGDNPIRELQQKIAEWFDLEFQLEAIEYGRPHFVHADISSEELLAKSGGQPALGADDGETVEDKGKSDAKPQGGGLDLQRLVKSMGPMLETMLSNPATRAQMKGLFAKTLGTADVGAVLGTFAPEVADLLLRDRNAVVIERLKETVGKADTSIAIFYGAAHMEELEQVLVNELGYRRAGARWIRAWDLSR